MGWIRRILLGSCIVCMLGSPSEISREKGTSSVGLTAPEECIPKQEYTKVVKEDSLERTTETPIETKIKTPIETNPVYSVPDTSYDSMTFLRANLDLPSDFDLEYNTTDRIMVLMDLSIKKAFSTDNWRIYIHHLSNTLDKYSKPSFTDTGFFGSRFSYDIPPNFSIREAVNSYILNSLTEGSPYSTEYLLSRGEEVFKYMGEEDNFRAQFYDMYFATSSLLYTPENYDDARTELQMIEDVAEDIYPEKDIEQDLLQAKMNDSMDRIYKRMYMGGKEDDVEKDLEQVALFEKVGEDEGLGKTIMKGFIYLKAFQFLVNAQRSHVLMSQEDGTYKTDHARKVVAYVDTSRVLTARFLGHVLEKDDNYEDMRTEAIEILEE